MLELLYLAILLQLIDSFLARRISRSRFLIVCCAGGIVWANTHGSFLLLPVVLGITAAEVAVSRDERWRDLMIAALLSAGAQLVNPWGVHLFGFATQSITSQETLSRIEEWQRPVLSEVLALPLLLQIVFAVAGMLVVIVEWRRGRKDIHGFPAALGVLRTIAFGILAISSGRHVMLFGVAAAAMIASGMNLLIGRLGAGSRNPSDTTVSPADMRTRTRINAAAAVIIVAGISRAAWMEISPRAQQQALSLRYPTGIVSELRATLAHDDRLLNEYSWGGFLIQNDILPVFIDGRSELYGDMQLSRYASIIHLDHGWLAAMQSLNITLVIMPSHTPLVRALAREGWKTVARDSIGSLLENPARGNMIPEKSGTL
jgi:hypothetical protein